jgi:transketolase
VTHHSIEDIAIMNALPNMKVLSPAYSWEAVEATKALIKGKGPVYMRLGKSPGIDFSKPDFKFALGKGFVVREGKDIVLVSTGNVLDVATETARLLEEIFHKPVCVISMPSVKPLDETLLLDRAKQAKALFTIEEHSVIGGLGACVSSFLFESGVSGKKFHAFGFPDSFLKAVGDRDHLLGLVGIESHSLAKKITEIMKHPQV